MADEEPPRKRVCFGVEGEVSGRWKESLLLQTHLPVKELVACLFESRWDGRSAEDLGWVDRTAYCASEDDEEYMEGYKERVEEACRLVVEASLASEGRKPSAIAKLLDLSEYSKDCSLTCAVADRLLNQDNAEAVKQEMELYESKTNPFHVFCRSDCPTEALAAEALRLTTLNLQWYGKDILLTVCENNVRREGAKTKKAIHAWVHSRFPCMALAATATWR